MLVLAIFNSEEALQSRHSSNKHEELTLRTIHFQLCAPMLLKTFDECEQVYLQYEDARIFRSFYLHNLFRKYNCRSTDFPGEWESHVGWVKNQENATNRSPYSFIVQSSAVARAYPMSEQSETRVPHRESPEAEDVERPRPSMFTTAKCYLCSWWGANKGLVYIIIAEQLSSAMNAITRLLETGLWGGSGLHPLQILCFRMSMTLLWTLLYMYWARIPDAPFGAKGLRASLCIRGVAGFVGVAGLYCELVTWKIHVAVGWT